MNIETPDFESGLKENLFYLGVTIVVISGIVAANNVMIDGDERVEVGPTEVFYECHGIDAGVCLGMERPHHETHGYDEFDGELLEEGTEDYYRRVEAELMLQAYNICEDQELEDMDWLEEAEFENRSGEEWYEMDEVNLFGCEQTFRYMVDE